MASGQGGGIHVDQANRWQDWGVLILAAWLFMSPWVLRVGAGSPDATVGTAAGAASWDAWLLGAVVGIIAISAIVRSARRFAWILLALGAWLFLAPLALGFSGLAGAAQDHWIVGGLVFLLALWTLIAGRGAGRGIDLAHAGDRPQPPSPFH